MLGDRDWSLSLFAAELLCDWRHDERAIPVLEEHAFMTQGHTSEPDFYFRKLAQFGRRPPVVAVIGRGKADLRPAVAAAARAAEAKLGQNR